MLFTHPCCGFIMFIRICSISLPHYLTIVHLLVGGILAIRTTSDDFLFGSNHIAGLFGGSILATCTISDDGFLTVAVPFSIT